LVHLFGNTSTCSKKRKIDGDNNNDNNYTAQEKEVEACVQKKGIALDEVRCMWFSKLLYVFMKIWFSTGTCWVEWSHSILILCHVTPIKGLNLKQVLEIPALIVSYSTEILNSSTKYLRVNAYKSLIYVYFRGIILKSFPRDFFRFWNGVILCMPNGVVSYLCCLEF